VRISGTDVKPVGLLGIAVDCRIVQPPAGVPGHAVELDLATPMPAGAICQMPQVSGSAMPMIQLPPQAKER